MADADRPGEASGISLASAAFAVRRLGVAQARHLVINQFVATCANDGRLVLTMSPRADMPHAQQGRVQIAVEASSLHVGDHCEDARGTRSWPIWSSAEGIER